MLLFNSYVPDGSGLFIPATTKIADAEFKVTFYPNAIGIVELKETNQSS